MADNEDKKVKEIAKDPFYKTAVRQAEALQRVEFNQPESGSLFQPSFEDTLFSLFKKAPEQSVSFTKQQFQLARERVAENVIAIGKVHGIDLDSHDGAVIAEKLRTKMAAKPLNSATAKDNRIVQALVSEAETAYGLNTAELIAANPTYKDALQGLQSLRRVHAAREMSDEAYNEAVEFVGNNFNAVLGFTMHLDLTEKKFQAVVTALQNKMRLDLGNSITPPTEADRQNAAGIVEKAKSSETTFDLPLDLASSGRRPLEAHPGFQEAVRQWQSVQRSLQPVSETPENNGSDAALEAKVQTIKEKAFGMDAVPGAVEEIRAALKNPSLSGEDKSHAPTGEDWQKALGALKDYNERHPGNEGAAMNVTDVRAPGTGQNMALGT